MVERYSFKNKDVQSCCRSLAHRQNDPQIFWNHSPHFMTLFLLHPKPHIYVQSLYSIIVVVVIVVIIVAIVGVIEGLVRFFFSVHSPVIETAKENSWPPIKIFCLMTSLNTQRMCDNTAAKVQDPITLEITRYYSNKTKLNCFFSSVFFYICKKYCPVF